MMTKYEIAAHDDCYLKIYRSLRPLITPVDNITTCVTVFLLYPEI